MGREQKAGLATSKRDGEKTNRPLAGGGRFFQVKHNGVKGKNHKGNNKKTEKG